MSMTPAQLQTLKTDLAANFPSHDDQAAADAYNVAASPDFWVWRTSVTKSELVNTTSVDATTFNWTGNGFITRSSGEHAAWRELFNGRDACNPSLPNVRTAFQDIFSGSGNAAANRTHLATVARRLATRGEKLFASGTGSTASPGTMTFEGQITANDVSEARNLPA